jgi:hypothetical protein
MNTSALILMIAILTIMGGGFLGMLAYTIHCEKRNQTGRTAPEEIS